MLYSSLHALRHWDWKAILVCQIIAFTFWVFHSLNTEHTTNLDFPIEFQYNQDQIAIVEPPPKYVSVNVSGYGWNLLSKSFGFRLKPIQIPVNFPLTKTYLTSSSLMPAVTNGLKELKVNHLLEDSIFFRLDTIVMIKIPVLADARKVPLEHNTRITSSIRISPDSVHIVGPSSLIESSQYRKGIPIDYDFEVLTDEFDGLVGLGEVDYPLHVSEPNVLMRFHTATYKVEHTRLRIQFKNVPDWEEFRVNPEVAYVEYLLREGEEPIDEDNAYVELDFNNMNWPDSTIFPTYEIPLKYLEPRVLPKKFKVYFEKKR